MTTTSEFTIIAASNAYLQATKTKREEILGMSILEIFPHNFGDPSGTGVQYLQESLQRVVRSHLSDTMTTQKYDVQRLESEGGESREKFWGLTNFPVLGANGKLIHIIHRVEDVTELTKDFEKRVDERTQELKNSENQLRLIADAMPALISYIDCNFIYRFVNSSYESWFGQTKKNILGKSVLEVLGELAHQVVKPYMDQALTGQKVTFEKELPYHRGGTRFVHVTYLPDREGSGEIKGIFVFVSDISILKKAEQDLKASEEQFRFLANSMPQLAWIAHKDGYIYWYNQGWYNYTGKTPEEMMGWGWQSVHDPKKLPHVIERWKTSIETGSPFEMEFPLRGADGNFRWFLTRVTPIKDSKNQITQWFGTNTDIEAQKKAEQILKQSHVELELRVQERTQDLARSNADLEQFAYVTSHDLREPLRMVANYAQLLERRYKGVLDATASKYIGHMVDGSIRMGALIADLLAYARIGKDEAVRTATDMNKVLNVIKKNLASVIKESHASIIYNKLPIIQANTLLMEQLVQNLVSNALKFHEVSVKPKVQITAEMRGDAWLFSITDNGIGIEEQYADRIFIIFQRLHHRTEFSGTGIGLAICKKIVERHGGKIWMRSNLGEGTTFQFTIPFKAQVIPLDSSSLMNIKREGVDEIKSGIKAN